MIYVPGMPAPYSPLWQGGRNLLGAHESTAAPAMTISGTQVILNFRYIVIPWPMEIASYHLPITSAPTAGTKMRLALYETDAATFYPTTQVTNSHLDAFDCTTGITAAVLAGADSYKDVALATACRVYSPGIYLMAIAYQSPAAAGTYRGTLIKNTVRGLRDLQYNAATADNANIAAATWTMPTNIGAGDLVTASDNSMGNFGVGLICNRFTP